MREIIRMVHGSHLYGTNVETSDRDFKAVFIPEGKSILLGRVKNTVRVGTYEERNQPGEEDLVMHSLQKFLHLLCQNQPEALDMLFTPECFWVRKPEPEWLAILANRERFLSKRISAFVGYCRSQARKYAVKLERYGAVEQIVYLLRNVPDHRMRVSEIPGLKDKLSDIYTARVEEIPLANNHVIPHISVCDTRVPMTATVREAYEVYSRKFNEYGKRVARSTSQDADWKSMMHAVRIANEAVEFLTTGKIIFPRPEAEYLLGIRQGKVPFAEVSERIDEGLGNVERALEASQLPEEPDWEFADRLVETFYRHAALEAPGTK